METLMLKSNTEDLKKAGKILENGGLVAFPTETVYGLGADARNPKAVLDIFKAKNRPADNPLIVHIYDKKQLDDIVSEITPTAKKLMDTFWPGPLTVVMKKTENVPSEVSAGLDTVAVRMPENEIALSLLEICNLPVAAPSANSSGKPSPTASKYVYEDMNGKINAIIDGGDCRVGLESTVVDATGDVPVLLRPGGVTYEMLLELFEKVELSYELEEGKTPRSPGQKYKHYAPKADVYVVKGNFWEYVLKESKKYKKVGIMAHSDAPAVMENCILKNAGKNPEDFANRLFANLRDLDNEGVEVIFAEDIDKKGINLAVSNRLYKSAGGKFVNG